MTKQIETSLCHIASFAPFDDPDINSAGEIILLKEKGGFIRYTY